MNLYKNTFIYFTLLSLFITSITIQASQPNSWMNTIQNYLTKIGNNITKHKKAIIGISLAAGGTVATYYFYNRYKQAQKLKAEQAQRLSVPALEKQQEITIIKDDIISNAPSILDDLIINQEDTNKERPTRKTLKRYSKFYNKLYDFEISYYLDKKTLQIHASILFPITRTGMPDPIRSQLAKKLSWQVAADTIGYDAFKYPLWLIIKNICENPKSYLYLFKIEQNSPDKHYIYVSNLISIKNELLNTSYHNKGASAQVFLYLKQHPSLILNSKNTDNLYSKLRDNLTSTIALKIGTMQLDIFDVKSELVQNTIKLIQEQAHK